MITPNSYLLDFEIDKLTDSILNRISGDSFRTEIALALKSDLNNITKSKGWSFDWKYEFNQLDREVYKLTIANNMGLIIEPEGIDFVIQSKPLTNKQEKELSMFIAKRKLELKMKSKKSKDTELTKQ